MDVARARYRFTASYHVSDRFQAGLEWNPQAHEAGFIGNYTLASETPSQPLVSLGTSSDRIGTPSGPHCYFVTFAKKLGSLKAGTYVSLNYSEFDQRPNIPFGLNVTLAPKWDARYMMDGRRSHLLLTHKAGNFDVSFMWIWLKHPGISISWGL